MIFPLRSRTPFAVNEGSMPLEVPAKGDPEEDERERLRSWVASNLVEYRRHRDKADLPPLRLERDMDAYKVETGMGTIWFYPVEEPPPVRGRLARRLQWRGSVEIVDMGCVSGPPDAWEPPSSDEKPISDHPCLLGCVFTTMSMLGLDVLMQRVADEERARFEIEAALDLEYP